MADNVIRVDDEAYRYLNSLKSQGDTFNDAVHRLINEHDYMAFVGGEPDDE